MQIKIQLRDVYGCSKAYPVDANAVSFAAIAGTKTLTYSTIWHILQMGYTIIEVDRHGRELDRYFGQHSEKLRVLA